MWHSRRSVFGGLGSGRLQPLEGMQSLPAKILPQKTGTSRGPNGIYTTCARFRLYSSKKGTWAIFRLIKGLHIRPVAATE